jgi:hypothetical protein
MVSQPEVMSEKGPHKSERVSSGEKHKEKDKEFVSSDFKSYKSKYDKKEKMKKVVYYKTDTSTMTSSSSSGESTSKKPHHQKTIKTNYSQTSFNYSCVPRNTTTPLLWFYLENHHILMVKTSWRSHKMMRHLYGVISLVYTIPRYI